MLKDEWTQALLQIPSVEEQLTWLEMTGRLTGVDLGELLDVATGRMRSHPDQARQLAVLCAAAAPAAGVPLLAPRATYLQAQSYALHGQFDRALAFIQAARQGFIELGATLEAIRTNLGRIHILNEVGRHREALDAAEATLAALAGYPTDHPQASLMRANTYQNQGICYETTGRYDEALAAYAQAETGYAALGMTERLGEVSNNRGIVLVHLGRLSEALMAFIETARIWETAGLTLSQAQTLNNLGEAYLALGQYARSLETFSEALRLFGSLGTVTNQHILLRKMADVYLALNLYPEALATYRQALAALDEAGMSDHRARALWGLGATHLAQEQLVEADTALAQAAELFASAGNQPTLAMVLLEQADLHQRRDQWEMALEHAQQALELVAGRGWPVQEILANLRLADLLGTDASAAGPYLLEAQRLSSDLALPAVTFRVHQRLGHWHRRQNNPAAAQIHLEMAVGQIETLRGTLAQEAISVSFLHDKTTAYEDLIRLHLDRGGAAGVEAAFTVAEQAKARSLVDLLTGVLSTGAEPAAGSATAERLATLQADLNATYNEFFRPGAIPNVETLVALQSRRQQIEEAISRLRLQESFTAPAATRWSRRVDWSEPLTLPRLRSWTPPGMGMVVYHILGEEILAFVGRPESLHVVRHLSRVAYVQDMLQHLNIQWERFRVGRDFAQRHLGTMELSTRRVLAILYDELMRPLEPYLSASDQPMRLVIIPHGLLHQLPFHALFDGRRYLLDRLEMAYAPSVTTLALSQQRWPPRIQQGLVVGVADALTPAVQLEVDEVTRVWGKAGLETRALLNEQARLTSVDEATPGSQLLHLACHGFFRADNPMFSALKLHDEWLTAAHILQGYFQDVIVTLSACESGRSHVFRGDEAVGLPRAFLGAGAAAVVVSLWLVSDEATVTFMRHWYGQLLSGVGPAAALRAAQLAVKEEYPHPYYWAPFVLIGRV